MSITVKNTKDARAFITWMRKLLRSGKTDVVLTDLESRDLTSCFSGVLEEAEGWTVAKQKSFYTPSFHNRLVDIFNESLEPSKPYDATKLEFVS